MNSNMSLNERIYEVVKQVSYGKVASYGQIAKIVGCNPRSVGYALAGLNRDDVPWHRIINSKGQISLAKEEWGSIQRQMLEAEGIEFSETGKIDIKKYGWIGIDFGLFQK